MRFDTIEVTLQAPGGLDWNSLLSAVLGGLFALAGVLITQARAERTHRETRLDELVEACRSGAMALTWTLREGPVEKADEIAQQLRRVLISLQAHGKRWEKKHDKAHRGFADTITALSREMEKRGRNVDSDERIETYLKAVDALALACVFWEEQPAKFSRGDRSEDILSGRMRAAPTA